jgi:hypothetical protein
MIYNYNATLLHLKIFFISLYKINFLNFKKMIKITSILLVFILILMSCKKDHVHSHDHDTITVFKYSLTAPDGSVAEFKFEDYDGDGGNPGLISVSNIKSNTLYSGRVSVFVGDSLNLENITSEIQSEGVDHEFFYSFTGTSAPSIIKTDVDANNNPLGINTTFNTSGIGTFPLTIILRHKPTKPNTGLQSAGGDTDVEVNFNVVVQ